MAEPTQSPAASLRCRNEFRLPGESMTRRCELRDGHRGKCGAISRDVLPRTDLTLEDARRPHAMRRWVVRFVDVCLVASVAACLTLWITGR